MEHLFGSDLVNEFTTFPRGRYDDGVDAAGMLKDELNKRWNNVNIDDVKNAIKEHFKKKQMDEYRKKWRKHNIEPWELDQHRRR